MKPTQIMSERDIDALTYEWIHTWFCFVVLNDLYKEYCELKKSNSTASRIKEIEQEVDKQGGDLPQFYADWGDVHDHLDVIDNKAAYVDWITPRAHLFDISLNSAKTSVSAAEKGHYIPIYIKQTVNKENFLKAVAELYEFGKKHNKFYKPRYRVKSKDWLESDKLKAFKKSFVAYSYTKTPDLKGKKIPTNDIIDYVLDLPEQKLFNWSPLVLRSYSGAQADTKTDKYKSKANIFNKLKLKGKEHCRTSILGYIDITESKPNKK